MATTTILIVDDEESISWALRKAFERAGHQAFVAASAEGAFQLASRQPFDAVMLDVRLPGLDGLSAIARLRDLTNQAPIVIMTAHGNLETAVRAIEQGAFEYLPKPFDLADALDAIARALKSRQAPASLPRDDLPSEEIVGRGPAMQSVFKRIALVAGHDSSVLITGESGTGKELVARALHRHSPRRNKPFLPVHVAALNPSLVESELFGHVRGAFTGAAQAKPGLLALADGGTVFLDELADIPLPVQAKLLRVLEHQEVLPVGASSPSRINVRILSATHQDLVESMRAGSFRNDLFYRLNVFEIRLPALRDRPEDLPALVQHFLSRLGVADSIATEQTIAYLRQRSWSGNVRELRNAIEHAVIVARNGPLSPEHFPPPLATSGADSAESRIDHLIREWARQRCAEIGSEPTTLYDRALEMVEKPLLDEVLRLTNGNRLAAARWLGLARATLRKMLAKHQPAAIADDSGDD
jgi:two-component system nitrogen regulation response regulator GlnG